jgi:hypothetical protein
MATTFSEQIIRVSRDGSSHPFPDSTSRSTDVNEPEVQSTKNRKNELSVSPAKKKTPRLSHCLYQYSPSVISVLSPSPQQTWQQSRRSAVAAQVPAPQPGRARQPELVPSTWAAWTAMSRAFALRAVLSGTSPVPKSKRRMHRDSARATVVCPARGDLLWQIPTQRSSVGIRRICRLACASQSSRSCGGR